MTSSDVLLVDDRLEVHYQPIVDLRTRRVRAVEALARWRDPDGTLLAPPAFLDAAERTELIVELGQAVRRRAIAQVVAWSNRCDRLVELHVNVSPREFDGRLVPTLLAELERSGLPPHALVVEITESRRFVDVPEAATIVQVAREHGIRVAIGDVGASWASVDRLHALDVDLVKIDRSAVSGRSEMPRTLTSAIVAYAHRRDLQVVAEGIERPGDVPHMIAMGCLLGQGRLLGPPATAEELTVRLEAEACGPAAGLASTVTTAG